MRSLSLFERAGLVVPDPLLRTGLSITGTVLFIFSVFANPYSLTERRNLKIQWGPSNVDTPNSSTPQGCCIRSTVMWFWTRPFKARREWILLQRIQNRVCQAPQDYEGKCCLPRTRICNVCQCHQMHPSGRIFPWSGAAECYSICPVMSRSYKRPNLSW